MSPIVQTAHNILMPQNQNDVHYRLGQRCSPKTIILINGTNSLSVWLLLWSCITDPTSFDVVLFAYAKLTVILNVNERTVSLTSWLELLYYIAHDWKWSHAHAPSTRMFISPSRVSLRASTLSNCGQSPPLWGLHMTENGLSGWQSVWWLGLLRHCVDILLPRTSFSVCRPFTKYWHLSVHFFHWFRNTRAIISTLPTNVWTSLWSIRSLA